MKKDTVNKKAKEIAGKCMVLRETEEKINTSKVAEVVAGITGQHRFDVLRQLQFSRGIIAGM